MQQEEDTIMKQSPFFFAFSFLFVAMLSLCFFSCSSDAETDDGVGTPPSRIEFVNSKSNLAVDESFLFGAIIYPVQARQKVTYTSSDESVATVGATGLVKGIAKGNCTITATATLTLGAGLPLSCSTSVVVSNNLILSFLEATLQVQESLQLQCFVGNTDVSQYAIWNSSDESVATVKNGIITATKTGETTITALYGNATTFCKVTVERVTQGTVLPQKIELEQKELILSMQETANLSPILSPDNITASYEKIIYRTLDASVATVDDNGKITAKNPGNTIIFVSTKYNNHIATCKVTVQESLQQ